jgi:hypothetical protein
LNAVEYHAKYGYQEPPAVRQTTDLAYRRAAEDCLAQARMGIQRQAVEQARVTAYLEKQREAADRAEKERQAGRVRAQAMQETRAREQAETEAAEKRESEARAIDPAFTRAQLSAQLCYMASSRKHAKGMIDNERQGARAGLGIIDKEEVYKWQGELVIMAKLERLAKAALKARKLSPLACKADTVASDFADCIDNVRQGTMIVDEDEDEYLASAKRIAEYAPSCTPWKRLTPEASASDSATSTEK